MAIELIKRLLLDSFPGMRFDIELSDPQYVRTNAYRKIEVTYNEEVAAERGITQRDMRRVLQPVITQDQVQYGSKEYSTLFLARISFVKKRYPTPTVKPERVAAAVEDLKESTRAPSSLLAVQSAIEVMKDYTPRAQHGFFDAVIANLKSEGCEGPR